MTLFSIVLSFTGALFLGMVIHGCAVRHSQPSKPSLPEDTAAEVLGKPSRTSLRCASVGGTVVRFTSPLLTGLYPLVCTSVILTLR